MSSVFFLAAASAVEVRDLCANQSVIQVHRHAVVQKPRRWRAPRQFDLCTARDAATGTAVAAVVIWVVAGLSIRGAENATATLAAINRMNVRIASYHSSALRLHWLGSASLVAYRDALSRLCSLWLQRTVREWSKYKGRRRRHA